MNKTNAADITTAGIADFRKLQILNNVAGKNTAGIANFRSLLSV
jgi:hypothetical protein